MAQQTGQQPVVAERQFFGVAKKINNKMWRNMKDKMISRKTKIIIGISAVVVIGLAITILFLCLMPESFRSIKITEFEGRTIITDVERNQKEAYKGINLKSGDEISVMEKSNIVLLFDSDKYMFADEGTKFRVEALGSENESNTKTRIILEEGSVLCRLDKKLTDEEVFEVETPNSTMSVRGTIFRMSIYQDDTGENYTRVDVLEGSVKTDLHMEDGSKVNEAQTIEPGKSALVHSNPDLSEFVIGETEIPYDEYSQSMSQFIVSTIESGREICVDEETFIEKTGMEKKDVVNEAQPEEEADHKHVSGDWEIQKKATCIEKGEEVKLCQECKKILETRETDIIEHSYSDWNVKIAATCTKEGVEEKICTICDKTEERVIKATGHNFGNWEISKEATCTTEGSQSRTCSGCNGSESQAIAALGHDYAHTSACTHKKQGVGPYTVGQQITLDVTTLCSRCQASGGNVQTTGTIKQIHADYPDFCEYSCSCGHVGTY